MTKLVFGSAFLIIVASAILGIKAEKTKLPESETIVIPSAHLETQYPTVADTVSAGHPASNLKTKELDLSGDRVAYIYGVIDETNSPAIARQILELGKDPRPINILINSPGGSVLDGAMIISAMQAASGPVNTVCVQLCASMAAMIEEYGTNRFMLNQSILMFHPATGGVEGEVDKSYSRLTFLKGYIGKMENNVAKRSKMTYEAYKAKAQVEWWVDAEDSVVNGLSDSTVFVRGSSAKKVFLDAVPEENQNKQRKLFVLPETNPNPDKVIVKLPDTYDVPTRLNIWWF